MWMISSLCYNISISKFNNWTHWSCIWSVDSWIFNGNKRRIDITWLCCLIVSEFDSVTNEIYRVLLLQLQSQLLSVPAIGHDKIRWFMQRKQSFRVLNKWRFLLTNSIHLYEIGKRGNRCSKNGRCLNLGIDRLSNFVCWSWRKAPLKLNAALSALLNEEFLTKCEVDSSKIIAICQLPEISSGGALASGWACQFLCSLNRG